MAERPSIFIDESGRRWRRIRRVAIALGVLTSLIALVIVASLVFPPIPPEVRLSAPASAAGLRPERNPRVPLTELQRERVSLQRKLRAAVARYGTTPARRAASIPASTITQRTTRGGRAGKPIVAGFYVNWDDNAFASLTLNLQKLDWVVGEWGFLAANGDSLRISVDRRVLELVAREDEAHRPQLFMSITNFDSVQKRWSPENLRALLTRPAVRARALRQVHATVETYGLAGVTIDFEEVPPDLADTVLAFTRDVHAELARAGRLTTAAIHAGISDEELKRWAGATDRLFPMLFDEHYGKGDPGPIATQRWYEERARHMVTIVPASKLVLMIGAYGYDWNDADYAVRNGADAITFQEVMAAARASGARPTFDRASLNSLLTYQAADSVDHVIWFLDAVTAWNEIRLARTLGVAGSAIWRLGGEDRAIWNAIGEDGTLFAADSLRRIPSGYYPEIVGSGEILQITAFPTDGSRVVRVDPVSGEVTGQNVERTPVSYVVSRFGGQYQHRVALTFDDGPDSRWTPHILDTLASRGVHGTFFVIGRNVDAHIPLIRRMYREGNEIGNHTFNHPNLALTRDVVTRLEIDATERVIEAVVDRGTTFFRPPYFGDAEPTTAEELVPVGIASRRRYWTIGLHVDSEDWQESDPDSIVATVLRERPKGNIILLHDSGGDRSGTVAALGIIIDSLRARGDTLVLVSDLAGITRDQAMPPLATLGRIRRLAQLAGFGLLGGTEILLYWFFTIAVVLGIARLMIIGALAIVQRLLEHQRLETPTPFAPPVSVLVPAYNEEKVIARTIESVLTQRYAGDIEVIVVDDGSRDGTADAAQRIADGDARITVIRKANGGKASALNVGLTRASHLIVVALDADTIFSPDTVRELVQPLSKARVGAVAGNAKVGNRVNIVTRWQALEYVTSQNLDRRAFSLLNCITVVPGAVGAWRRDLIRQLGGFRDDTLAEDQDLTLEVRRAGYQVAYADAAVAYTEAPDTLRGLARQRFRWSFGTLQCAWKHRDALFRPRYGALGSIGLPNVWLFQLLLPAISPLADLLFVWSLVSVWSTWEQHGSTYALTNLSQVMTYYVVFLVVDWGASMLAFLMEPGEDKSLTWLIVLQRFAYRQVMYWVVVKSFIAAVRGRVVGWGNLERKATVSLAAET
ncbi:MAG: putative glycosyl transferase/polysaccharide deacetylase [Gemmatimonadetes bacterium]|nr:putative glycosyl transferase/polysaccharide deacetylase [Gemmatimonadota bacterium]